MTSAPVDVVYGQAVRAEEPDVEEQVQRAGPVYAPILPRRLRDWRPTRRVDTPPEALILAAAQEAVDFPLLAPRRVPWGYFLAEQSSIPHHRGFVTLRFRSRAAGQWWITQRSTMFSLQEEMIAASERCDYVTHGGRRFAVCQSARIGEPVEWHWSGTRQVICWQEENRMCEVEAVRGYSPRLEQLLAAAGALEPAAPLITSALCRVRRNVRINGRGTGRRHGARRVG